MSVARSRLPAAQRRSQLLDAALVRFAAMGFHETSMDEIAERAGVTKPVLYQHFASKRDLYLEVLRSEGTKLVDALEAAAQSEDTPFQRVLSGFRAYFAFVGQHTAAFEMLFGGGALRTPEFAEAILEVEEQVATTIARHIDVDISEEHRMLLGYGIVGAAEVASRQWVIRAGGHHRLDAAEGEVLAERLAALVWAGLRGLPAR